MTGFYIHSTMHLSRRRSLRAAVWAGFVAAVALAGCVGPQWPPDGKSTFYPSYRSGEPVTATSVVRDAMDADPTLEYDAPHYMMIDHSTVLWAGIDRHSMDAPRFGAVSDTTTWADVVAFHTAVLAGTGLTRDSTADGFVETTLARHGPYDPLATETPRVRSWHAAWTYDDRWGDRDLTFSVMLSVVQSGYPGRTYRFLNVREPQRTWW